MTPDEFGHACDEWYLTVKREATRLFDEGVSAERSLELAIAISDAKFDAAFRARAAQASIVPRRA